MFGTLPATELAPTDVDGDGDAPARAPTPTLAHPSTPRPASQRLGVDVLRRIFEATIGVNANDVNVALDHRRGQREQLQKLLRVSRGWHEAAAPMAFADALLETAEDVLAFAAAIEAGACDPARVRAVTIASTFDVARVVGPTLRDMATSIGSASWAEPLGAATRASLTELVQTSLTTALRTQHIDLHSHRPVAAALAGLLTRLTGLQVLRLAEPRLLLRLSAHHGRTLVSLPKLLVLRMAEQASGLAATLNRLVERSGVEQVAVTVPGCGTPHPLRKTSLFASAITTLQLGTPLHRREYVQFTVVLPRVDTLRVYLHVEHGEEEEVEPTTINMGLKGEKVRCVVAS